MLTSKGETVLKNLRKLSPLEQLKVISIALPEIEKTLDDKSHQRKSLRGLWKGLNPSITTDDIAVVRREMGRNFPREDF